MKRLKGAEWLKVINDMETINGYKLSDVFSLHRSGYVFRVRKQFMDGSRSTELQLELGPTPYCCGVGQMGNFNESNIAKDMSDETLIKLWTILISFARNQLNKGIVNGWFYKPRRLKEFQHPTIERMFKLGGAKRIGKISFNPNSYNKIKGYQFTII
jgi:hypothetical protein